VWSDLARALGDGIRHDTVNAVGSEAGRHPAKTPRITDFDPWGRRTKISGDKDTQKSRWVDRFSTCARPFTKAIQPERLTTLLNSQRWESRRYPLRFEVGCKVSEGVYGQNADNATKRYLKPETLYPVNDQAEMQLGRLKS
jgi:hypothetical protein